MRLLVCGGSSQCSSLTIFLFFIDIEEGPKAVRTPQEVQTESGVFVEEKVSNCVRPL